MSNINSSETNSIQRAKAIYSKINFWSCIVAILMAVAGLILTIVTEFVTVNIHVHLAVAITICTIGLLALFPMIFSWIKLRKIEKKFKSDNSRSDENN